MEQENLTTVVSMVYVLGKVLDLHGLDKIAIARQVGIDVNVAYKPNDRISTAKLQKVWALAEKKTADDALGLSYAKLIQPASLCGLGLSWITSNSLHDSISRLIRFQHALTNSIDFYLNELDDCYQVILRSKIKKPVNSSVDAAVATLFQMCCITYGENFKVDRICIAHARPKSYKKFNEFFGVNVEFDAAETQIFYSKNIFEMQLLTANPDLARMNDEIVIEYLKHFDKDDIVMQVRARIIEELNNGIPNQEKIAVSLNVSLRNLQRKLKDEGSSFKTILDETRSELSKQYLRGSHRSIIEVGFLLGFSEPSNFARAFRRWNGVSPNEYREMSLQS